jgi:hypothetical protein
MKNDTGNLRKRKAPETVYVSSSGATEAENMKRRERRKAEVDEDDERLAREVLAEFRQGWVAQRQTARAQMQMDRKLLEVCALQDNERMAFRPVMPSLTELLCKAGGDHPPRAGGRDGFDLLESTEPENLPGETRKALALWTRYRLACLELMGGGRTGDA